MIVFTVLRNPGSDKGFASGRRLILYSAYAWGIPLIIVITCIALGLTRTVDTGYHGYGNSFHGSVKSCIMKNVSMFWLQSAATHKVSLTIALFSFLLKLVKLPP